MAVSTQCPGCSAPLHLRDELAGKTIKCPRCAHVFRVPSQAVVSDPGPERAPSKPAVEEEDEVALLEPVRSGRRDREDDQDDQDDRDDRDDEDDRPRRRKRRQENGSEYVPCPKCDAKGAERVLWTPWGSFYGPAMLTHVRCPECGYAYNGKTGRSNLIPAIIFVTIPLLAILGIVGGMLWYVFIFRYK
jgi:DNA-directed RNA polymerase subunit M/transcription elongation factor TFIIS